MGRYTSGGIGRDIVAGALAGAAAVWLIDKLDWSLSHAGGKQQPGMNPAHAIAAKAAGTVGADLGDPSDNPAGRTVHYGVGIGIGALYGLLRSVAPAVTTGRGALYGLATFILADEVASPAMGLSKSPLEYPARDHARGALAHTVFGIATDLGTRVIAPWRDEVVIEHGPSLSERIDAGRDALEEGRDYLYDRGRDYFEQGRGYASDLADEARSRVEDLDLPSRFERGRKRVRQFADDVWSRLPDQDDVADLADRGRKQARGLADDVRSRLPDADDVADVADRGRKRARRFAESVSSRLPDQDDAEGLADEGRKRAKRWARDARSRMPDEDDVDDMVHRGRKQVRSLAEQARAQAEAYGGSGVRRALRWLFG